MLESRLREISRECCPHVPHRPAPIGFPSARVRFRWIVYQQADLMALYSERENAGLNVTCARRVFLVEPVVNHAFEVQAISRIDRMGQTHSTEVFCYFAEGTPGIQRSRTAAELLADTVEDNILNLAARQGLSLYTQDQSHGTLDATAMITTKASVDSPSRKRRGQKGDFVAKADDMMQIMWPHIFAPAAAILPTRTSRDRYTTPDAFTGDAIAGPSRQ